MAKAASARTTTALPLGPVLIIDGQEHLVPPVGAVDVARPELGGETVAVLVEDEEGMVTDRLEVAVVGRPLLRAAHRTLRIQDQSVSPARAVGRTLDVRIRGRLAGLT
jgi:hypothetical protein